MAIGMIGLCQLTERPPQLFDREVDPQIGAEVPEGVEGPSIARIELPRGAARPCARPAFAARRGSKRRRAVDLRTRRANGVGRHDDPGFADRRRRQGLGNLGLGGRTSRQGLVEAFGEGQTTRHGAVIDPQTGDLRR